MRILFLCCILFFYLSCDNVTEVKKIEANKVVLKYAKGFTIEEFEGYKLITLKDAWRGDNSIYRYVLYDKIEPDGFDGALKIKVPIKSIACMSLTHISFIHALKQEKSIIVASGLKYTNTPSIQKLHDLNVIKEIGSAQSINYELLVDLNPSIVMTYGIDGSSTRYANKLKKLGLKPVINSEYMEVHPLGKAEWIKFVAAFYNQQNTADSIFNHIERNYLDLVNKTKEIKNKPSVFVGMPWNGNWYVAGGKSFQAQLFKDAGAEYLWKDNNEQSSIIKNKELVYNEAINADFWLNVNSYNSISSILSYDNRLNNFAAVKNNKVYNNDNKLNQYLGNEYWESGTLCPHIILKDLIEIFHPNIIDHKLHYYRRLD